MSVDSLMILAPLFLGYLIPVPSALWRQRLSRLVSILVYGILMLLGIGLGSVDDLGPKLLALGGTVGMLVGTVAVANLVGLWWWSRWAPMSLSFDESRPSGASWRMLSDALKTLGTVCGGVAVGFLWMRDSAWVGNAATGCLMILLLLIGCQLRNAGIALRRVLFNRQGLGIALTVLCTSMLAGLCLMPFLPLSWSQVLAVVSGFGWYSLSAIVIGDALGPLWGSAAFLNDMLREVLALVAIPALMSLRPALAIGYGGATTMDFTLPVIQRAGGIDAVPVAMASGFILSLLAPVLMAVFLAIGR